MVQYEFLRERSARFLLPPGVYGIVPATYEPDTEGEFLLRIATIKPVQTGYVEKKKQSKTNFPSFLNCMFINLYQA